MDADGSYNGPLRISHCPVSFLLFRLRRVCFLLSDFEKILTQSFSLSNAGEEDEEDDGGRGQGG